MGLGLCKSPPTICNDGIFKKLLVLFFLGFGLLHGGIAFDALRT